jgi:Xaa-Pro aminopeptidase
VSGHDPVSRRAALALGAGVAAGSASAGPSRAAQPSARRAADPAPPDLSFLQDTPLMDGEKLRRLMVEEGLDAMIVAKPANVFYVSNHWPQLDRMGMEGAGIAIVARDPAKPITLVMHAFLYYYTHTPESRFTDRQVFTYTNPTGPAADPAVEPPMAPARTMRVADPARTTPLDAHRAAMFARARPPSADASWALWKAVADLRLTEATVGIDDPVLEGALRSRGFSGVVRPGEDTIRRARLSKSPAELRLMRLAAQANVDAAMTAARRARRSGTARRLRADFFAEAARRGNDGHFMVIGGTSSEALDQPLVDGTSVSIDCVSTCRFYHGDFGRTIFIGEPRAEVRKAAEAVATAWQEIRERLRPGMAFADIPRIGRETLARLGADLSVSFTPHSVGLFHTDHPQPSLIAPRRADALKLEENMVLSVDCPVFMAGLGGTVHLEDLMWIRGGRAEPVHTVPPPIIVV